MATNRVFVKGKIAVRYLWGSVETGQQRHGIVPDI